MSKQRTFVICRLNAEGHSQDMVLENGKVLEHVAIVSWQIENTDPGPQSMLLVLAHQGPRFDWEPVGKSRDVRIYAGTRRMLRPGYHIEFVGSEIDLGIDMHRLKIAFDLAEKATAENLHPHHTALEIMEESS